MTWVMGVEDGGEPNKGEEEDGEKEDEEERFRVLSKF